MKIAFHSYKGGVGRTKVMVGTGAIFAMMGYRVGLLDFDLDASALATIFKANQEIIGPNELLHILESADPTLAHDSIVDVTDFIEERFSYKAKGCLKYIPTISNPKLADKINFNAATKYAISSLFDSLLDGCGIDELFIDLRPGYSPASSTIFPLVDKAVIVTRIDSQNISGLKRIFPIIDKKGLESFLVANLVPDTELANQRIDELCKATNHRVDINISYDPNAALDDDIVSVTHKDSPMQLGLNALAGLLELRK